MGQFLLLGGQHAEIGGIGRAENQRDTEHHKGRGDATQNKVLHTGLQRGQLRPLEAVEHVEGHGDQLQANKEQHQVIGRCGKEHPDQSKDGEGKKLRKPRAEFGREIHSHQHHGQGGKQEEPLEVAGEVVDHEHIGEGRSGLRRQRTHRKGQ